MSRIDPWGRGMFLDKSRAIGIACLFENKGRFGYKLVKLKGKRPETRPRRGILNFQFAEPHFFARLLRWAGQDSSLQDVHAC